MTPRPGLDADLATLRDIIRMLREAEPVFRTPPKGTRWTFSDETLDDAEAEADRVEAELARLREERDRLAEQGRIAAVRYGENFTRRIRAEAECARLQQALSFYADPSGLLVAHVVLGFWGRR